MILSRIFTWDVMTGSQEHHLEVRAKTLEHMETIAPLVLGHIRGRSSAMSKFSSVKKWTSRVLGVQK